MLLEDQEDTVRGFTDLCTNARSKSVSTSLDLADGLVTMRCWQHQPVGSATSFWVLMRNLVLAPITEELVFRACLVRLWVSASIPTKTIIFCSPFCFALAHTHHFIEHVRRTRSKKQALLQVLFQVFYTSLFGMYSNFLLIRTGSLIAVIMAHTFCNHQGFPDIAFLFSSSDPLYEHRKWLGGIYLCGIAAFACLAGPLTADFPSTFQ
eukprot:s4875_g3.t1